MSKSQIGIIILAAGQSKRMGQPKQLLQVDNETLVRRTIDVALATDARPVVLVVGANKAQIAPEIVDLPITIIDNPMWHTGMASSVKMGLAGLWMTNKNIEAAMILVCDQPYLSVNILDKIIETYEENKCRLVACRYEKEIGVPVLFDRSLFDELLSLEGEKGAKPVLMSHLDEAHLIDFSKGHIDLDTPNDYESFLKSRDKG